MADAVVTTTAHQIALSDAERQASRGRIDAVDPSRTALLVIDMQCGFIDGPPFDNPFGRAIIPAINRAAAKLRAHGCPIIWIQHTISQAPRFRLTPWQDRLTPRDEAGVARFVPGQATYALHPGLAVEPEDPVVPKHRFSAMLPNSSDLPALLSERGIDTLVIAGTATNVCCESTARDAYMMGYRVVFLADATAAFSQEEHDAAMISMNAVFASVNMVDELDSLMPPPTSQ